MKKNRLQKILDVLNGADNKSLAGFKAFDEGVQKLKDEMLKTVRASTLDDVNDKISNMKKSLSLDPLLKALSTLEENFYTALENMQGEMERMSGEHSEKMSGMGKDVATRHLGVESKISELSDTFKDLIEQKTKELANLRTEFNTQLSKSVEDIKGQVIEVVGRIDKSEGDLKSSVKDLTEKIDISKNEADKSLKITRAELLSAINSRGGGNANRNIAIGGNVSVLSRFTDINLKAGSNVTISYTTNQTTKYTDITFAATGGSGTVRNVASTSVSSTIGAVAGTDYVVICSAGVKIDLPTASGNSNLYTVKNTAASSVLVAPNGADTIDSDTSLILATRYTSVDLISDGVSSWNIT